MSLISSLYVIGSGEEIEISEGDWVDVVPNLLPANGVNGLSYQVIKLHYGAISILAKLDGQEMSEVVLSTCYVLGNYRKVSNEK